MNIKRINNEKNLTSKSQHSCDEMSISYMFDNGLGYIGISCKLNPGKALKDLNGTKNLEYIKSKLI